MNFSPKTVFPILLLLAVACAGLRAEERSGTAAVQQRTDGRVGEGAVAKSEAAAFEAVDLDRFIDREIAAVKATQGKRQIKRAVPVSFDARLKRWPETKQMDYIYTALEVAEIRPLPEVGHRMFVESKEGRIIPVYVEKEAAAKLAEGLAEGEAARFFGYHVYSYAKGPALLVTGFVRGGGTGKAEQR